MGSSWLAVEQALDIRGRLGLGRWTRSRYATSRSYHRITQFTLTYIQLYLSILYTSTHQSESVALYYVNVRKGRFTAYTKSIPMSSNILSHTGMYIETSLFLPRIWSSLKRAEHIHPVPPRSVILECDMRATGQKGNFENVGRGRDECCTFCRRGADCRVLTRPNMNEHARGVAMYGMITRRKWVKGQGADLQYFSSFKDISVC